MSEIKNLFEKFNVKTLPSGIYNRLATLDAQRSSTTIKGVTTYGELTLPVIFYFSDLDFYLLYEWYEFFKIRVKSDEGLYNEKGEKLTLQYDSYKYLFIEFGKGFRKGYSEFENDLQTKTKLFNQDNNQIAFKVFSHVDTYFNKSGFSFRLYRDKENMRLHVTPETMFNDGLEWGKQYKAWTIILDNITLFEQFFNKYNKEPQPIKNTKEKYTAKHYLLAYLFECNAKGESFPIGNKKELERIGNELIGAGKGNRFYKVFNEVINKDLNVEKNLIEIGGEYWRKAVIKFSKAPELVEKYLQSKQL